MRKLAKSIPEGTKDLIFEDCLTKRSIENKVKKVFEMRGYKEIITPSLEYLDVFLNGENSLSDELMYKLFDTKNRNMVLRPDNTMPIARLTATRLKDIEMPLRLYYNQNIFRINDYHNGKRNEITQCGIELIGKNGQKADIEVISTAVNALKSSCTTEFKIEIGHVGFFNELAKNAGLSNEDYEKIRIYTENKNLTAIDSLLLTYGENAEPLRVLPRLFGNDEVFEEAYIIAVNNTAKGILSYLKNIYDELCLLGYKDYILIDLGLVHHIDYYTGIIFRGYINGSGQTVLKGGRYDGLLSKFGTDLPSTGFAINIDAVADTISEVSESSGADYMIYYENGYTKKAYDYIDKLNGEGYSTVISFEESKEKALEEAKYFGVKEIIVVDDEINRISL